VFDAFSTAIWKSTGDQDGVACKAGADTVK
jgi:hypothetical protein